VDNIKQVNLTTDDMVGIAMDDLWNAAIGNPSIGAPGFLFAAKVDVMTSALSVSRITTAADVTPPTYDGHVAQPVTWTGAKRNNLGESYVVAARLSFAPTGSASIGTQQLYGVALYASDGTTLLGAGNFDAPITVTVGQPVLIDLTCQVAVGG
jgi:hypothetical protein